MEIGMRVTATNIKALVEKQGYRCAITGRELTPQNASLDHIQPLARGGKNKIENVWIVDHQVNVAKGTLTMEEFVLLCREVVKHFDGRPGSSEKK